MQGRDGPRRYCVFTFGLCLQQILSITYNNMIVTNQKPNALNKDAAKWAEFQHLLAQ